METASTCDFICEKPNFVVFLRKNINWSFCILLEFYFYKLILFQFLFGIVLSNKDFQDGTCANRPSLGYTFVAYPTNHKEQ